MISYKHCLYTFSIIFSLLNGQFTKSSELGELQVRKYISHLLDSLFMPQNHQVSYQQNLHNFSQELTNDLTRRLGDFPHFYSFSKVYDDNQIYQAVVNESLAFIEKSAHNLATQEFQQYYSETSEHQKSVANKVVDLLMKEIKTKLNKVSVLPQGMLTGYFGIALETKIHILIEKELKKEADRLEKLNAKIKCSICSEKFNTTLNKRITLTCSHTICLACLKSLWNKMGSALACSKCNSKINISEHVQGIWVTPASDYNYSYDYGYNYNE